MEAQSCFSKYMYFLFKNNVIFVMFANPKIHCEKTEESISVNPSGIITSLIFIFIFILQYHLNVLF